MINIGVIVADSSEDIEVIVPVDIWRRAGFNVELISIGIKKVCILANGIKITCDFLLSDVNLSQYNMIYLPGGAGCQKFNDKLTPKLVNYFKKNFNNKSILFGAICAAPTCLYEWGLLTPDIKVTCYPGMQEGKFDRNYISEPIVIHENLITGSGPGVAHHFAIDVVSILKNSDVANQLFANMQFNK